MKQLDAITEERDQLSDELTAVKAEQDNANLSDVHAKVNMEYKDVYIDHIVFLLIPHLDIFPFEVVAEIRAIPVDIGMIVTLPTIVLPSLLLMLRRAKPNRGEQVDALVVDS